MPSVISCLTVDVASFCAAVGVAANADYAKGAWLTNNKKHLSIKLPRKGSSAIKNIVFVCNGMTQNINI